jgi:hypothetical protein
VQLLCPPVHLSVCLSARLSVRASLLGADSACACPLLRRHQSTKMSIEELVAALADADALAVWIRGGFAAELTALLPVQARHPKHE